jgi:hypothetical protein
MSATLSVAVPLCGMSQGVMSAAEKSLIFFVFLLEHLMYKIWIDKDFWLSY